MAMERNFFEHEAQFASEEDLALKQNWKSVTAPSSVSSGDDSGSFECNICLDSAHDPVVTLCGHLYCWPCIYKWLNVNTLSLEADLQQPKCPVCKANISPNSVVPLYGRGMSTSESETKKAAEDTVIPRRPQPSALNTGSINMSSQSQQLHPDLFQSQSQSFHNHPYFPDPYGGYAAVTSSNLGGTTMTGIFNPMIGMFGELMFARIFGSSDPSLFTYSYPNSPVMGPNNLRARRQEMHLEKSLNRLSIFFLCCIILCLLLF